MPDNNNIARRAGANYVRRTAAALASNRPHPQDVNNADETTVTDPGGNLSFAGNYSKGLPHSNPAGDVDRGAYSSLLQALVIRTSRAFEQIRLGTPPGMQRRKLVNPQAGLAFDTQGPDAQEPTLPPAPVFGSQETAAEAAELYWMAIVRDVPFREYTAAIPPAGIGDAAQSLSAIGAGGEFTVPTSPRDGGGTVQPGALFRGTLPGDLVGPYVSQFLLQGTQGPCPVASGSLNRRRQDGLIGYGAQLIDQRILPPDPLEDFLFNPSEWQDSQNGVQPTTPISPDCTLRFIRNLRDLAMYVRADRNYQAYLNAALILQNINHFAPAVPDRNPIQLPTAGPGGNLDGTDIGNPYNTYLVTEGFATFGDWHLLVLLAEVTRRALAAAWYQKWFVHRRLRPEEYGGRVEARIGSGTASTNPDIDAEIIAAFTGGLLANYYGPGAPRFNDRFLPQAFPEGSPTHSAYPSGHATVAGACITVLKAWFDDERPLTDFLPNAFIASVDGQTLDSAPAFPATHLLAHELNKLASNLSIGRSGAGVHWRSDAYRRGLGANGTGYNPGAGYLSYEDYLADTMTDLGGNALGERVAIALLQEQAITYSEERRSGGIPEYEPHYFTFLDVRNRRIRIDGTGQVIV
jgi:membrane-associated phospholipid phosphatase